MRFTRLSAFAAHLGISFAIFLVLLGFIVLDWYRFPLFWIDNGWHGIQIIAGVDLVLGPLLTLIVFKPGKPSLKFDMSVIAAIQFAALVAGTWIVYAERPIMLVYADTSFMVISKSVLSGDVTPDKLRQFDNAPYPLAVVDMPEDFDERQKIRARGLARGGISLLSDLYVAPGSGYLRDLATFSLNPEQLKAAQPDAAREFDKLVARHGALDQFWFAPVYGRRSKAIFAVRRDTGAIVDVLDIVPPT